MITFDRLRPPSPLDPTAAAYKDWLHLNLFHHPTACVGLVNVSLHGPSSDPRSRAIGTALFHDPVLGWVGNVLVRDQEEAEIGTASLSLDRIAAALHPTAVAVLASARLPADHLDLETTAIALSRPVLIEQRIPLGAGWISWSVVPRLRVEGRIDLGGDPIDLAEASAYHDHNWGRWHWGQDFGWEWGAFLAPSPGPAIVFTRLTDRRHERTGPPRATIDVSERRLVFPGETVSVEFDGELQARPRRLPGAQAALHQARARPRLPARVRVSASDEKGALEVEFAPRAVAQLIAGDPILPGYHFLHELVGEFHCTVRLGGDKIEASGLGVFEYVD